MTGYTYTTIQSVTNAQVSPSETPTDDVDEAELHWLAHGDSRHYI